MDKYARKQLERALYYLSISDMEIVLFNSKSAIVREIKCLSDSDLLTAIYNYVE